MTTTTTDLRPTTLLAAVSAATILALSASPAAAQKTPTPDAPVRRTLTLLPPAPGDLAAPAALADPAYAPPPVTADVPREAVSFTYPLDPDRPLAARPAPYRAESREYWQQVEAAELAGGVPVYTTAPGALVRISPAAPSRDDRATPVDPAALAITTPSGDALPPGAGMNLLADAEALTAAGMAFPEGTAAVRIDPALGAGRFELRAPALAASGGRYLLHVVDSGSDLALTMSAGDTALLAGGALTVDAGLLAGGVPVLADELEGFLTAPDGRLRPVTFEPDPRGSWRADVTVARAAAAPGLWEIHARAATRHRGLTAVRSVRIPFALAAPTARFTGEAVVTEKPDGALRIDLPVEVSTAGRYEARGVLWATAPDRTRKPLAAVHAARWLDLGHAVLTIEIPADQLTGPLAAPWELRDLRLIDQGRMGLLHRQAEALLIP